MNLRNEATRAYIYRVALAVLALLVLYGVIASEDLPTWAEVIVAALGLAGNGLATVNTKTTPLPPPPPGGDRGYSLIELLVGLVIAVFLFILLLKLIERV